MAEKLFWNGKGWRVEVLFSRAGLSTVILIEIEGNGYLLMDCGDGCLRDLVERRDREDVDFGFIRRLKGVLISHGHFDHVGGLHSLLGFLRMIGYDKRLQIVAPKGAVEDKGIVENFSSIYDNTMPFEIDRIEASEGELVEIAGVKVRPFGVVHCGSTSQGVGLLLPANGYSLEYNDQKVVYTGDCGLDSGLERWIEGADLALVEGTMTKSGGQEERTVHLSADTALRLAGLARRGFVIHRGRGNPMIDTGDNT